MPNSACTLFREYCRAAPWQLLLLGRIPEIPGEDSAAANRSSFVIEEIGTLFFSQIFGRQSSGINFILKFADFVWPYCAFSCIDTPICRGWWWRQSPVNRRNKLPWMIWWVFISGSVIIAIIELSSHVSEGTGKVLSYVTFHRIFVSKLWTTILIMNMSIVRRKLGDAWDRGIHI